MTIAMDIGEAAPAGSASDIISPQPRKRKAPSAPTSPKEDSSENEEGKKTKKRKRIRIKEKEEQIEKKKQDESPSTVAAVPVLAACVVTAPQPKQLFDVSNVTETVRIDKEEGTVYVGDEVCYSCLFSPFLAFSCFLFLFWVCLFVISSVRFLTFSCDVCVLVFCQDFDFLPGQMLGLVFGESSCLLNNKGKVVRNATIPQSFKNGRFLMMENTLYRIETA